MSSQFYVDVPDFMRPLLRYQRSYPRDTLDEVIRQREEATPHLLKSVESVLLHPDVASSDEDYELHFFAIFLLAQFREEKAKPLILKLARHPQVDDLLGDVITEGLRAILTTLCLKEPESLKAVVEDREANEYARSAALDAMAALCKKSHYPREEFSSYMEDLYSFKLEKEPIFVWDAAVADSVNLEFNEHGDLIEQAYEEGLANPGMDDLASVLSRLENHRPYDADDHRYGLVDDIHEAISHWACFTESTGMEPDPEEIAGKQVPSPQPYSAGYLTETYVRPEPKIGRNDPCPCGSGKKYKKCCGA